MHVEASTTSDLSIARMNFEPRSGRFDISLDVPGSAVARRLPLRFTGTVRQTVEAAVLSRPVGRGDIIREADVTVERREKSEVAGEAIDADAVVGLSAKRPLRAGQVLRASDLMKAEVVQRNDHVTIVYQVPGVMLTVRGKALESGAVGELVSVVNVQSNRTVFAEVSGPGLVTIAATTPRLAAAVASENNRRRRAQ
jgi:flagella basal body P-ring formation protein FlgA